MASIALALILWSQPCRSAPPLTESTAAQPADSEVAASRTPIRRADSTENAAADRVPAPSLTSSLALLGLVLGGVYVILSWLRRRQGIDPLRAGAIDLLASRRLDAHATLHLVRIGPRVLAVGSSPAGARTLAVIDDPEEIAVLISTSTTSAPRDAGRPVRSASGRRAPVPADGDDQPSLMPARAAGSRSERPL